MKINIFGRNELKRNRIESMIFIAGFFKEWAG